MQLGYVIIYVSDVDAAVRFYEKAFALERRFVHESGQYAEMETGSSALAFTNEDFAGTRGVFRTNRADDSAPGIEIGFVTEDVRASFDRAVAAGAAPVEQPAAKPWGQTVSYVRDLNGVLVEICSPVSG